MLEELKIKEAKKERLMKVLDKVDGLRVSLGTPDGPARLDERRILAPEFTGNATGYLSGLKEVAAGRALVRSKVADVRKAIEYKTVPVLMAHVHEIDLEIAGIREKIVQYTGQLAEFEILLDQGLLTDEEFKNAKRVIYEMVNPKTDQE